MFECRYSREKIKVRIKSSCSSPKVVTYPKNESGASFKGQGATYGSACRLACCDIDSRRLLTRLRSLRKCHSLSSSSFIWPWWSRSGWPALWRIVCTTWCRTFWRGRRCFRWCGKHGSLYRTFWGGSGVDEAFFWIGFLLREGCLFINNQLFFQLPLTVLGFWGFGDPSINSAYTMRTKVDISM